LCEHRVNSTVVNYRICRVFMSHLAATAAAPATTTLSNTTTDGHYSIRLLSMNIAEWNFKYE